MFDCAHGDGGGSGAARRRRDRRLRMHWRHEQLSLRMLRASVGHHSWQSKTSVGVHTDGLPALAVTYVVPSRQLPPVHSTTTVTTGLVYPQFSNPAVVPSAPCGRWFSSAPVCDQVLQEHIFAGDITENFFGNPCCAGTGDRSGNS